MPEAPKICFSQTCDGQFREGDIGIVRKNEASQKEQQCSDSGVQQGSGPTTVLDYMVLPETITEEPSDLQWEEVKLD